MSVDAARLREIEAELYEIFLEAALARDWKPLPGSGRFPDHGNRSIEPTRAVAGAPHGPKRQDCEEALQRAVMAMIAGEARPGCLAFHVPNGGKRGRAEAGRLKAMGTLAGVPDLIVLIDGRAHGLELKTARGRLSASQKALAERWRRAGGEYDVARSIVEARAILARWGALAGG